MPSQSLCRRQCGLLLLFAIAIAVVGNSRPAFAQENAVASSPEKAKFDALFKEWKAVLGRMRALQEKYQVAGAAEKPQVEAEFNQLREKGKVMAPQLLAAAEAAYVANPKNSREVGDFLMATVADGIRSEQYEEAARMGKLLLDHGYDDKVLYAFYALGAYANNDFETAKKYFDLAQEAGKLEAVKPAAEAAQAIDIAAPTWPEEAKLRAAEAKADDLPRVKLTTSKGDIVVELFENEAPNTVANYINLVEKGFYDGLKFHRVIPGFMAQGGDPKGDGTSGPGYTIPCECTAPNHRNHFRGSLSMAHAGPNTGGSQFFLTFLPTVHLNGKHTVFGRVIEGMDVLGKLQRTEGVSNVGPPDKIIKAEVLRKRDHEYVPKKN